MEAYVKPGKYVVAVSGGVDSMALFDMLVRLPELDLVVAHFEHGIRADSDQDRQLVAETARRHGLPFVFARGNLGSGTSEARAREARYAFLRQTREEHGAEAIITAHHQDDMLETALINLVRGTGPRGLSSLQSTTELIRPLLNTSKQQILDYARTHKLTWHEDSTNTDEKYLRNYLRLHIMPRMSDDVRQQLLQYIVASKDLEEEMTSILMPKLQGNVLDRKWFTQLPHDVSRVAVTFWLRNQGTSFTRKTIHRLVIFMKIANPGSRTDVDARHYMHVSKSNITLVSR